MRIVEVNTDNLIDLFELNRTLAAQENQSSLFTATLPQYEDAFLGQPATVGAYLCELNDEWIGFYTYLYKFATYRGARVLHIEDVYLEPAYREGYIAQVLNHAVRFGADSGCCRVEMRVLKNYNMGYESIDKAGFRRIEKWDVFRYEGSL